MSKRNIEPGWHEPVQDVAGDEWENELNALHETVVREVEKSQAAQIPNGLSADADGAVRSNTLNSPSSEDSAPATDHTEMPAFMRVFHSGSEFVKDNAVATAATAATAAAGIGWLLWNSRATPGPAPALDGAGDAVKDAANGLKDAASGAIDQAKSMGASLADKVKNSSGGAVEKVKGAGSQAADKVKDLSGQALDSVKDMSGHALDTVKDAGGHAVENAKSMTSSALENVKSAGANAAQTASSAVSNAAQTASSAVAGAAQKVGSTGKDQAKRVGTAAIGVAKTSPIELAVAILSAAWLYRSARPARSADSAPGAIDQISDQAKTGGRTAIQAIEGMVQKNPLAAGGIALVIGAIIGLLIPESNVENRVMGPKHDELMDKAMDAAHEFTDDLTAKVKAVATEAVNTVKEEAKNQGLVAGGEEQK